MLLLKSAKLGFAPAYFNLGRYLLSHIEDECPYLKIDSHYCLSNYLEVDISYYIDEEEYDLIIPNIDIEMESNLDESDIFYNTFCNSHWNGISGSKNQLN